MSLTESLMSNQLLVTVRTVGSVNSVTNSEHNCAHVSTFGTIVAQKMSEKLQNEHNFINLH